MCGAPGWGAGAGLPARTATATFARRSLALHTPEVHLPLRAAKALPPAALHALLCCLGSKGSLVPPNCSAWPQQQLLLKLPPPQPLVLQGLLPAVSPCLHDLPLPLYVQFQEVQNPILFNN